MRVSCLPLMLVMAGVGAVDLACRISPVCQK